MTWGNIFFSERITNVWNGLPSNVVNASTVNDFKSKIDAHWSEQEQMYNYCAEMTGTGSRRFAQWVFSCCKSCKVMRYRYRHRGYRLSPITLHITSTCICITVVFKRLLRLWWRLWQSLAPSSRFWPLVWADGTDFRNPQLQINNTTMYQKPSNRLPKRKA